MALSSLTPLAWRIADAEAELARAEQAWQRAIREGRPADVVAELGIDVNWALDSLDKLRGEAGL